MNKLSSTILLIVLSMIYACSNTQQGDVQKSNTSIVKYFDDASDILLSWPKKNTIISHVLGDPDNLHPTNGSSSPRSQVLQFTQKTLLYTDYTNQSLMPGLVKSMPVISDDGLLYTYELNDNITWDDGQPLTVADIVFTAKVLKCPLTNNPSTKLYWENIENILQDSVNKNKFTIVMKKKRMQNISSFVSFTILQKSFHDKNNILSSYTFEQFNDSSFNGNDHIDLQLWAKEFNDDKYGRDPEFLNGLGMYKVTQWENGQYITLTRKKNHWTQKSKDYHDVSYPGKIIFKINKDEASQMIEFRSQEMDVSTNLSVSTFIHLSSDVAFNKNYNYAMMPTYNYTYVCFNQKPDGQSRKKLFDDKNVRKAFALLIPVDKIIKLVYKQYSDQSYFMVSNVSPLKAEFNRELKPVKQDINAAEKLLNVAGWKDTDNDGILDKNIDGVRTSLIADLGYLSSAPDWKDMALLIMEELAKAGIKVNPVSMELKLFLEKAKMHDFDLLLGSWGGTSMAEDYTQLWHTSSWTNHGSNYPGFGNEESDKLIDSLKYEIDESSRTRMSHRLQKIIYDDQPYVFLYVSLRRNVIHKRFANQMIFSERPGILENMLRLLSINKGITINEEENP